MGAVRAFQPVQAKSIKRLNDLEATALVSYSKWLKQCKALTLKYIRERQDVETFQLPDGLERVLKKLGRQSFRTGKQQGIREARNLQRHYQTKKKLSVPPTFNSFKVTPIEALQAMDERELYISGNVTTELFRDIKDVLKDSIADTLTRSEAERALQTLLDDALQRASLIVTTETTYGVNRGRLQAFVDNGVDYVEFLAIRDDRTSAQCRTRHGKIMAMNDPKLLENTPPLHGRCRSILSPIYSAFEPELVNDEQKRNWNDVSPLPNGWRK